MRQEDAMPTIRNWVIATAAAFLVLPLTNAQARDCKRYPSLCVQPVAAKAAAATSVRVTRQVQKRKAAKRTEKFRIASKPSRAAAHEQPANPATGEQPASLPATHEQPASPASRGTSTIDAMVILPQSLADAAPAALAKRYDRPVVAAAGSGITLPSDDAHTGVEVTSPDAAANAVNPVDAVRFVDPGDANEIDLAAVQSEPAASFWLRYLLATLGATLAAAASMRFLFV
jgi:hypothetical protein